MPVYREFLFDDGNLAELNRHNISFEDVVAMLHGSQNSSETEEVAAARD